MNRLTHDPGCEKAPTIWASLRGHRTPLISTYFSALRQTYFLFSVLNANDTRVELICRNETNPNISLNPNLEFYQVSSVAKLLVLFEKVKVSRVFKS